MKKLVFLFVVMFSLNIMANNASPPITTNADNDHSLTTKETENINVVMNETTLTNILPVLPHSTKTEKALLVSNLHSDFAYTAAIEQNLNTTQPHADGTLQFFAGIANLKTHAGGDNIQATLPGGEVCLNPSYLIPNFPGNAVKLLLFTQKQNEQ